MEIRALWEGTGRAVRRWLETERSRRELASMDAFMRADLGLQTEIEVAALARNAWRDPGQFRRMLERVGASGHPFLANRAFRRELERSCALCTATRTCRRWLASGDRDGYRTFCPNAAELSAMATERQETQTTIPG